jgi:hypothetical protein
MSSSSLGTYRIQGNSGPTGPIGPIGPTGGTGNTGPTGPTGNFGLYIVSSSAFTSGITLTLSDGSLFQVLGNFRGITTNEVPDIQSAVSSSGNIVSLLSSSSGGILQFRGISAFGSLFLTDDGNNIHINSNVAATPSELDIAGLTSNSLVYLKTNTQISSTTVGVSFDNNNYNGTLTYDNLGNKLSRLNPSYKTKYIGPVQKDEEPIYINCDVAGVFYLNTPIGIAGITGSFRSNEVISITLIPEDENIWHFPENVYFEQGENYLTCGKSVVNLTSTDQGNTWLATVSARGFDINKETCDISNTLGSCCYQTVFGELTTFGSTVCIDYTTREVCDSYFGTFNPLVSCDKACGITGICCTSGNCIENVSPTECAAYGGITCGAYENDPTSTNFGNRLCPNPCEEDGNVGCCVEGNGLGVNLTRLLCEEYFGGIAVQNPQTTDYECCEQGVGVGPCCTESGCVELNKIDCGLTGGVYMGETFRCEEVNCDCIVPVIGSCCLEDGSCQDDISQVECQNLLNGNFSLLRCDERNCSIGACCDGSNCTDTTLENCQGTFYLGDSCSYIECDPVACCFPTGQCADMSRLNCLESGGTPLEGNCQGQSCIVIDDPGPGNEFGFCCVNGQCVESLQSECSGSFSSESCAALNCDPTGPGGPDDPEEDGGDGWPPVGPPGPGGGGGNGGGGVNGTNCDPTGRCCCLEFSYCEVKLENNQWRTTKKNVKRQVCTSAGSPPVNCDV